MIYPPQPPVKESLAQIKMPPYPNASNPATASVDLDYCLGNLSTSLERLGALRDELGFKDKEIAKALNVHPEAVRKWLSGERIVLRDRNAQALDDFRAIVEVLYHGLVVDRGHDKQAVRNWFVNRPGWGVPIPLDYVYSDPGTVGGAAEAQVAGHIDAVATLMASAVPADAAPEPVGVSADVELPPKAAQAKAVQGARRRVRHTPAA